MSGASSVMPTRLLKYSKTCIKRQPKNRQNKKILKTNGSLVKVKSIADSAIFLTCI